MVNEKLKTDWDHTANLMALNANINRGKGKKEFTSYDFHPYRKQRKKMGTIHDLKMFLPKNDPNKKATP